MTLAEWSDQIHQQISKIHFKSAWLAFRRLIAWTVWVYGYGCSLFNLPLSQIYLSNECGRWWFLACRTRNNVKCNSIQCVRHSGILYIERHAHIRAITSKILFSHWNIFNQHFCDWKKYGCRLQRTTPLRWIICAWRKMLFDLEWTKKKWMKYPISEWNCFENINTPKREPIN